MNRPNPKDYATDDGMHAAMRSWAKAQQRHWLEVEVTFVDEDDAFTDVIQRAKQQAYYRTRDGELWDVYVDSPLFANTFLPGPNALTEAELKSAFEVWVRQDAPVAAITWKRVYPTKPSE